MGFQGQYYISPFFWRNQLPGTMVVVTTRPRLTHFLHCHHHHSFRRYEPEVLEFLLEHGSALRIDPARPCTEEQSKWEALAKTARGSVGHE